MGRAVDDLVKMGYPESVAKRISSGELPMDYESRMARAREQGYDMTPMYHTGSPDITNISTSTKLGTEDLLRPFFLAKQPEVSQSYGKVGSTSKWLDEDNLPYENAGSLTYPIVTKGNYGSVDAGGKNWNQLRGVDYTDSSGNLFTPIDRASGYRTTNDIADIAQQSGDDAVMISNVVDIGTGADLLKKIKAINPDVDPKQWLNEYQRNGGDVMALINPNNARSLLSAAFDPEYKGANILGGSAGLGILGGLLADYEEEERKRGLLDGL